MVNATFQHRCTENTVHKAKQTKKHTCTCDCTTHKTAHTDNTVASVTICVFLRMCMCVLTGASWIG